MLGLFLNLAVVPPWVPDVGAEPDLVKSKPRPQIGGGSSANQKRPESRPTPSSGIQPVKVRVLDDKKLGASKQKALPAGR